MFVGVIVSVMFKFFGHIQSVMLNRSNDYSSFLFKINQHNPVNDNRTGRMKYEDDISKQIYQNSDYFSF